LYGTTWEVIHAATKNVEVLAFDLFVGVHPCGP